MILARPLLGGTVRDLDRLIAEAATLAGAPVELRRFPREEGAEACPEYRRDEPRPWLFPPAFGR